MAVAGSLTAEHKIRSVERSVRLKFKLPTGQLGNSCSSRHRRDWSFLFTLDDCAIEPLSRQSGVGRSMNNQRNRGGLLFLGILAGAVMSGACAQIQNRRRRTGRRSPEDTLIAHEHETWSLIQRKELKEFASYLAEEFYDVFPDGEERTKSELLEFLSKADLKDYRLAGFRVTMLNQDAAIVTYQVHAHALIQGNEIEMKNSVTAGWAKRGGRWLNVSAAASALGRQQLSRE